MKEKYLIKYFGTESCPQCRVLRPRVEEWCKERQIEYKYLDADNEDNAPEIMKYSIRNIPSVVITNEKGVWLRMTGISGWDEFINKYD